MNKAIKNLAALTKEYAAACAKARELEEEVRVARLAVIQEVQIVKNERSTTLVFGSRKVNASRNRYGRLMLRENGKTLVSDYSGSIHDVRLDLVCDAI